MGNGPVGSPMGGPGPNMGNGPMPPQMGMPNGPIGPPPPPPLNNNFMMGPMANMYPKPMPVSAGKVYPADQPMVSLGNDMSCYVHSNFKFK